MTTIETRSSIGWIGLCLVLLAPATARAVPWDLTLTIASQTAFSQVPIGGGLVRSTSTLDFTNVGSFLVRDLHAVPTRVCFGLSASPGCPDAGSRLTWNDTTGQWEGAGGVFVRVASEAFRLLVDPAVTNLGANPPEYVNGDNLSASFVGDLASSQTVSAQVVFEHPPSLGGLFFDLRGIGMVEQCGDGEVVGAETCDDGNTEDGDCCTSSCVLESDGSACDDGDACTTDVCAAGTCVGTDLPDDAPCDDGVLCTYATCQLGVCVGETVPDPGLTCRVASKSILVIKEPDATGAKDRLIWKWIGGTTPLAAFGDPSTEDGYELCVYDETSGELVAASEAPPSDFCNGKPCWKATGSTGWKYKDSGLTPDGVLLLSLKAGDGKSKIIAKGKGANLGLAPLPRPLPAALRARLLGGADDCWESEFSGAEVLKNDAKILKAKDS